MIDPVYNLVAAEFIGLLLLASGIHKLLDSQKLTQVVAAYRLVPDLLVLPISSAVTASEIGLGAALILRIGMLEASLGAALLLVTYAVAISISILKGRTRIDCGCSWRAGSTLHPALVVRNLLLTCLALVALLPTTSRSLIAFDVFQAIGATIALGIFYFSTEALLVNAELRQRSSGG
jgi:Methylamine utilisation protein MauE